ISLHAGVSYPRRKETIGPDGALTGKVRGREFDNHHAPARTGALSRSSLCISASHASDGGPYGRNFSSRPRSSLCTNAGGNPTLRASGVSTRTLQWLARIWNSPRISNSRSPCRSRLRLTLFRLSHQTRV